jgi:hypothetical protein
MVFVEISAEGAKLAMTSLEIRTWLCCSVAMFEGAAISFRAVALQEEAADDHSGWF